MRRWLVVVLVLVAGCAGSGGKDAAAPATTTTTTVAPTTTKPDPGEAGCKKFGNDPDAGKELMLISRDERIVNAAKAYDDASGEGPSGAFMRSIDEIVHACQAAGYDIG